MNAATNSKIKQEQKAAWIGDAVLGLFVREWIVNNHGALDGEQFTRFTSNDSLAAIGNPTAVEAAIGAKYSQLGLQAAFLHIETQIMPHLEKRERVFQKAQVQRAGAKSKKSKRTRWKKAMGLTRAAPNH
ncbi:MAG: ribonuclease III domain-containing protein [Verrucomicrobiota bacterium]